MPNSVTCYDYLFIRGDEILRIPTFFLKNYFCKVVKIRSGAIHIFLIFIALESAIEFIQTIGDF